MSLIVRLLITAASLASLSLPTYAEELAEASPITSLKLISTLSNGTKSNDHTGTYGYVDANRVLLWSRASNFPQAVATFDELYIKNLKTKSVTIVSTNASGVAANSWNQLPTFSADKTLMAFTSNGSNMFDGDQNTQPDILVKNLKTGKITVASLSASGQQSDGWSDSGQISKDGKRVYFYSLATNLVSGDTNKVSDIFEKTLSTGKIRRVSTTGSGKQLNSWSSGFVVSPDGKYIYFNSEATNIDSKEKNEFYDIFRKNLKTGAVTRVSTTSAGKIINGNSYLEDVSPDGTKIVFVSYGTNLPSAVGKYGLIYLKDLKTGKVSLVSASASGKVANKDCWNAAFSPDGKSVFLMSWATNLVATKDTNLSSDIFIKNLKTGAVTLATARLDGKFANGGDGHRPYWSADGKSILYETTSTDLNTKDTDDKILDVYIAKLK